MVVCREAEPGDVAVLAGAIDYLGASRLVRSGVGAVVCGDRLVEAAAGVLADAGVAVVDSVGSATIEGVSDGDALTIIDGHVLVGDTRVGGGSRRTSDLSSDSFDSLRLTDSDASAAEALDWSGRHALVIGSEPRALEDLDALRRNGYLSQLRPAVIAVGAAGLSIAGQARRPIDVVVLDSAEAAAAALDLSEIGRVIAVGDPALLPQLRAGASTVDHLAGMVTPRDAAELIARRANAELVVTVGLDEIDSPDDIDRTVDAAAVAHIYRPAVRPRDLVLVIGAALFAVAMIFLVSEPARLLLRGFWFTIQ